MAGLAANSVTPTSTPASTSTSTPSRTPATPDPNSVTPGVAGFLVIFILAIVTWLLLRNMTGRLRRMRYREEQRIEREGRADSRGNRDQSP